MLSWRAYSFGGLRLQLQVSVVADFGTHVTMLLRTLHFIIRSYHSAQMLSPQIGGYFHFKMIMFSEIESCDFILNRTFEKTVTHDSTPNLPCCSQHSDERGVSLTWGLWWEARSFLPLVLLLAVRATPGPFPVCEGGAGPAPGLHVAGVAVPGLSRGGWVSLLPRPLPSWHGRAVTQAEPCPEDLTGDTVCSAHTHTVPARPLVQRLFPLRFPLSVNVGFSPSGCPTVFQTAKGTFYWTQPTGALGSPGPGCSLHTAWLSPRSGWVRLHARTREMAFF